jgi:hypothetical protein
MKILSNFRDYYDKELEESSLDWEYNRVNGMTYNRKQALNMLQNRNNTKTIDCAFARNAQLWDCESLVVYLDPNTHNANKRTLMPKSSAIQYYPDCFVTPYIEREHTRGETLKYLKIGRKNWNIMFVNNTDVLCEGEMYSAEYLQPSNFKMETPIWSVDYIRDKEGKWVAIDFNDNPNIAYMQCRLKPSEVVQEIKWFLEQ